MLAPLQTLKVCVQGALRYIKIRSIKSFTLVELLIVIAILAVLAAAVVIVLNPAELLAQARDSQRVTDLKTTKDAVDLFVLDNPSVSLGVPDRVYVSLPDTASNCPNLTGILPTLPAGWQYVCATTANLRNTNGTGWIPLDFSSIKGGSPMPFLPIDPTNDAITGKYYTYTMGGSYELTALLESRKSFAMKDGGAYVEMYEVGSDLSLLPISRDLSLIGYWRMDEGSGAITADSSGKGNNGTFVGAPAWQLETNCKRGSCLSFNGTTDYVNGGHGTSLDPTDAVTISAWGKLSGTNADYNPYITKGSGFSNNFSTRYGDGIVIWYINGVRNWVAGGWAPLKDGNWHQVVGTYDKNGGANNMKFYYDGVLRASVTSTGSLPVSTTDLRLGNSNYGGSLDEVRIYNRALSDAEVKSLYEATK